jgi:hypothetical protein
LVTSVDEFLILGWDVSDLEDDGFEVFYGFCGADFDFIDLISKKLDFDSDILALHVELE